MKKSKIFYDEKSDVLYFLIKEGFEEKHVEITPGINVELDRKGNVLGLEILNASRIISSVIPPRKLTSPTTLTFAQQTV